MSRRAVFAGLLLILVVVFGIMLAGERFAARSSSLSRGAEGWFLARRYLEARGVDVELQDRPLSDASLGEARVLVLAFPWQKGLEDGEREALLTFLRRGGTLILAYSADQPSLAEDRVLTALGFETRPGQPAPSLVPWRWWRAQSELWQLEASGDWPADERPAMPPGRIMLATPASARVLFHRPQDEQLGVVFDAPLNGGQILALPVDLLSNAFVTRPGNGELLERLRRDLGSSWVFDEYHHGLRDPATTEASFSSFAWDLFFAHLGLIYLLGMLALARRFGPAWRDRHDTTGSTASFLLSLGVLHHQLGHHSTAARLLIERARELDPKRVLETTIADDMVADQRGLLELARRVARAQNRRADR